MVESFETVAALYAQQLPLNENITFTLPSLTLVAESVSSFLVNNLNTKINDGLLNSCRGVLKVLL